MAILAQPQVFINYISQRKKIIVTDHNQPTQLLIQTDYYLNDTLHFKVLNVNNQVVTLDSNTTYQLYGTYIDSKKQVHILFYTLGVIPTDNTLSFLVNTYTSEYLAYVKNNRTQIDISIVAKQNVGGSTRSYMVLRDIALANPRGYIEGQAPTDIVYQNVFTTNVPVSGVFGAGSNNLSFAQDPEGQQIYSFAFGDTLSTSNANQFVIGYNNEPDATKAFIVANSGNIFTVDYEGNVEAGDLNVGAISATSITVSGEDLNQVIDDKVEYLSTSIDDKLSATEDWVSDTFETKESATQTFNELEGDINDISAFVSGLPNDIAAKADQTDLDAISSFVSGLPQDINDISNAMNQKADKEKLNELSGTVEGLAETKADLSALQEVDGKFANYTPTETIAETYATKTSLEDYAKLSAIPTGNAQLENTANYITAADIPTYTGVAPIVVDPETYEISLDGEVGETYTAGFGLALDEQTNEFTLTGTVLQGDESTIHIENNTISVIGGTGGEGREYSAGEGLALSGNGLSTFVLTAGVADLDGYDTLALKSELNDLATKDALDELSSATSGLPSRVETLETAAETYALADNVYSKEVADQTFATKGEIPTVSDLSANMYSAISGDVEDQITGKNYITSDALNGLATEADLQYVSGVVSAQAEDITALKAVSGEVDYETVFDMLSSGDTDTLTITKDDQNEKIVFTATGGSTGGVTPTQVSSIVEEYGYQNAAQVSSIVEGYDYITAEGIPDTYAKKTDIPTTVAELTDSSDYAKVTDLTAYIEKSASGQFATSGELASLTQTVNGKADSSAIPTKVSDLTQDIPYLSAITSADIPSEYVTDTELGTALADYTKTDDLNIPTNVSQLTNDVPYLSAIPTSYVQVDLLSTVSGNVLTQVQGLGYITDSALTDYAQLSDLPSDYTTSAQVSSIVNTAISEIPGATEYDAGTGLERVLDGNKFLFNLTGTILTGGTNIEITGKSVNFTGTIPTTVAQLTDAGDYAKKTDIPADIDDFATSAQVSSIVEGYGYVTENTTYSNGNLISITGATNTINFTGTIPSNSAISGIASSVTQYYITVSGLATQNDIPTSIMDFSDASSYVITGIGSITNYLSAVSQLQNDVGYTTETYVDGIIAPVRADISALSTVYDKLSAGANIQLIKNEQTGVTTISAANSGGGGGGSVEYTSLTPSLLAIDNTNHTLSAATQSGGGGGGSQDLSDYNNDVPFITAEDITNKQRVLNVNGNIIAYDSSYEIFKTTYTVSAIVLYPVTALTSQIGNGEVATFEEWITLIGSGTTTFEVDSNINLIGEFPSTIDNSKTHVLVRRLYNNNGTIVQYVSYAYSF